MYIIKLVGRSHGRKSELFVGPHEKHADCEKWLINNGFVASDTNNSHWKHGKKVRVREYESSSEPIMVRAEISTLNPPKAISVKI